jgi:hypothetical protein
MDDPVLDAHEVSPGIYLLSGTNLRPVSIRDQILRGAFLIRRLIEAKVLDDCTPLLIVGAGVAGVAAAIEASRNSVDTVLIERKPAPFTTLEAARTRVVDPVLYDWPIEHWRNVKFPWGSHDLPLEFVQCIGSDLAALWTKSLVDAVLASRGKLVTTKP